MAIYGALAVILVAVIGISFYKWRQARKANQATAETTLTKIPGKKSLVVMHFENRSGSNEIDWLREGLADMLITNLSRSNKLSVLSRQQLHILLERMGHNRTDAIQLEEALTIRRFHSRYIRPNSHPS
jgi:TolB-like protein